MSSFICNWNRSAAAVIYTFVIVIISHKTSGWKGRVRKLPLPISCLLATLAPLPLMQESVEAEQGLRNGLMYSSCSGSLCNFCCLAWPILQATNITVLFLCHRREGSCLLILPSWIQHGQDIPDTGKPWSYTCSSCPMLGFSPSRVRGPRLILKGSAEWAQAGISRELL